MSIFEELSISLHVMIFIGSLVQRSLGFGMAVIASPYFMLVKPELVPVALLMNAMFISIINAWKFRHNIELGELWFAFLGRIPGTLVAVYLLSLISNLILSLIVGLSVLMAVFVSRFRFQIAINRKNALIAGFFSRLMGTSSGVGGPPMAILYQNASPHRLRGNLSLYFTVSCLFSLSALALTGQVDHHVFKESLSLYPAALLGTWCARYPLRYINPKHFRNLVLALCSLAAVSVLLRTLYALLAS